MLYVIVIGFWLSIAAIAYSENRGKKIGRQVLDKEYRHTLLARIYGDKLDKRWQDSLFSNDTGMDNVNERILARNAYDYSPVGVVYSLDHDQVELLDRLLYEVASNKRTQAAVMHRLGGKYQSKTTSERMAK